MTIRGIIAIIGIKVMGTKEKKDMTSIQVQRSTVKQLQNLWAEWNDTYDAVILRLLNGVKGDPHEDMGGRDESAGVGPHQEG